MKYQEDKKKNMQIEEDWRQNKSFERDLPRSHLKLKRKKESLNTTIGSKVKLYQNEDKNMLWSFFKDTLNKSAGTPIKELYEGIVSTFAKLEYEDKL